MKPARIKVRENQFLDIFWDNGETKSIKLNILRNACPCAICAAEKNEWSKTYIPLFTLEQLKISKINVVGTYAIGIEWADGHNTGLYDFEYLYNLYLQFSVA